MKRRFPDIIHVAVAAGSALGAVTRYGVTVASAELGATGFPWATLSVNVAGSFAIGLLATLAVPGGRLVASPAMRQFMTAGFCGGLTTFSIFSLETVLLTGDGRTLAAGSNIALSFLFWIPSAWLGHVLGSRLNQLPGSSMKTPEEEAPMHGERR